MSSDEMRLQALRESLVQAFIHYQWRLDNPFPQPNETEAAQRAKYFNDPLFRAKVDSLTYGITQIVTDWLDQKTGE